MFPEKVTSLFILSFLVMVLIIPAMLAAQEPAGDDSVENMDDLLLDVDDFTQSEPQVDSGTDNNVQPQPETVQVDGESAPDIAPTAGINMASGEDLIRKDVILVLDNSGSMRQNDPDFLTSSAVTEFITGLDDTTRVAVIIFDQDVSLAVPLTRASLANRGMLLDSLDNINYRGLFTDSPAAIERAIYELKNNGREEAQKVIIFMTDGIVDTGNADEDLDKSRWLRESLAPDAADAGIKIFGIAFTEDADFRLIQSLAQVTGGEYYRALQARDIALVFDQINTILHRQPVSVPEETPPQAVEPQPQPQPQVIVQQPPPSAQTMNRDERIRSIIIISAVAVMILAVLAILILLIRRGRAIKAMGQEYVSEAYLNDIHGYTSTASYRLGKKPTMLGRVAGMDTEHLDYIVIPESTVGRRHSLIEYKDFAFWIVDQGSINGTFVNDVPITSETRLKHGDRIRLHKFEFEFVMPEMVDAGMTVVSNTVMAAQGSDVSEATEIKGTASRGEASFDLDLDISGDSTMEEKIENLQREEQQDSEPEYDSEDETLMPDGDDLTASGDDTPLQETDEFDQDTEDETLVPGSETDTPPHGTNAVQGEDTGNQDQEIDDETLMPGDFNLPEEDATIRREGGDEENSLDNFVDISGTDDEEDK